MKRIFSLILLPTCHLLSCTTLLFAQTADADWDRATRYWNHQKYNAAQHLYDTWLAQNPNASNSELALARYRSTACAIELQHQDAVKRVRAFESAFPEHPLVHFFGGGDHCPGHGTQTQTQTNTHLHTNTQTSHKHANFTHTHTHT